MGRCEGLRAYPAGLPETPPQEVEERQRGVAVDGAPERPPLLRFSALPRLGVAPALAERARRCAGAEDTTAVQVVAIRARVG